MYAYKIYKAINLNVYIHPHICMCVCLDICMSICVCGHIYIYTQYCGVYIRNRRDLKKIKQNVHIG